LRTHESGDQGDRPPAGDVSRRQTLRAYAPPALVAIDVAAGTSLGISGPASKPTKGNNGSGQEKQGAPKDGAPAGKAKNDKPGPR
jgi:hypothetical protein